VYAAQGKYDRAEPLYQEVLQARSAKLGPDHPDNLNSKHSLGCLYLAQGRYERAEPLLREAVAGARRKLTLAHPRTQDYMRNLTDFYQRIGQPAKAEPLCHELAEFCKQQAGADSPQYAAQLAALGTNLLAQTKCAEAELVLRDCLAIRVKKEPDVWTTFNTKSLLGGALAGQKKYGEAEPLLLQGYYGIKQVEAKIPKQWKGLRLAEALERLVLLYDGWNNKEKAAEWRTKLEAQRDAEKKTDKPKQK
jgi:tetratricopeptide (TPR) repeat protein